MIKINSHLVNTLALLHSLPNASYSRFDWKHSALPCQVERSIYHGFGIKCPSRYLILMRFFIVQYHYFIKLDSVYF